MSILDIFRTCPPCEFGGTEYFGDSDGFTDHVEKIIPVFDAFSENPLLTNQIHKVYKKTKPLYEFEESKGEIIITYKKDENWYCFTIPFVNATHYTGKKTAQINISNKGWFTIGSLLNVTLGCDDYSCCIELELFIEMNKIKINLGNFSQEFPLLSLYVNG